MSANWQSNSAVWQNDSAKPPDSSAKLGNDIFSPLLWFLTRKPGFFGQPAALAP
jgi:hypothetical protein